MLVVNHVVVSDEIINTYFKCDLNICKGMCCRCGDTGATVSAKEIDTFHLNFDIIKDYVEEKGLRRIENNGNKVWEYDPIGRFVLATQDKSECVFGYYDNSILFCAVEKSNRENRINFNKPISCHLYPIKHQEFSDFDVLSLHRWDICQSAFENGQEQGVLVYEFAKEPLIRKFGEEWYIKLLSEIEKIRLPNNNK